MVEHERSVLSPLDPCRKATLDELSGSHSIYGHLRHIRYSSLPLKKKKKHNQDTTKTNDPSTSHFLSFRTYGPQCGLQYSYFRWRYSQAHRDRHCHSNNDSISSYLKETKKKKEERKSKRNKHKIKMQKILKEINVMNGRCSRSNLSNL